MTDDQDKPKLPDDKGQFGAGDATEDYKPLQPHPDAKQPEGGAQTRTEAGERS